MDCDYSNHFKKVKLRFGRVNPRKPVVNLESPYDLGKTQRIPNSDSQIAKDPRLQQQRFSNQSNSPSNLEDIMAQITNLKSKQGDCPSRKKSNLQNGSLQNRRSNWSQKDIKTSAVFPST